MHKHGGDVYQYPNFIDFSANINLLGTPPKVLERVRSAAEEILHYPQPGSGKLRHAIAELEQVQPQQVFCGNGAAEVIFSLALAQKPKRALLFAPTFQEYEQALRSVGCKIRREYLRLEQGFRLREENLLSITPEIDLVFLCNPNNPTGILTEPGMLKRLADRCRQAGAVLAVDECFLDFASLERDISPVSCSMKKYLRQYPNLFIIKAFTKTFGMPGLRLGYGLCGNEERLARMREVTQPWNVSVLAQEAGIAAAKEKAFLEETRKALETEKSFLLEHLMQYRPERGAEAEEKEGFFIRIYGCGANFIFFRSRIGLASEMKKFGILIRDCSNFPGLEEGWYRIAVRPRKENEVFVQALREIEKQIKLWD
ncbi:MAG: aminotransferase class I/II-fold pyridoxal phosphate-dependent enzyme [Lachnospiraceae bacterium]|nr:aminotransferase class I/II-fold pyridoxal phosphate-dependent enzyme [Lachnospiraceae bacterium]